MSLQPVDEEVVALAHWLNAGKHIEVERTARKILLRFPSHPFGLKALAMSLIVRKRHAEALPLLEQAIAGTPTDAELHANLGIVLIELGRPDGAVVSFNKAIEFAPGDADNLANLGTAQLRLGCHEAAVDYCRKAIALQQNHHAAWNALGATLLKQEKYEDALAALSKAIESYPGDYYQEAVGNLGNVLVNMRKYHEAHALYEELNSLHPEDSYVLTQLIQCSLHLCQWDSLSARLGGLATMISNGTYSPAPPFVYLAFDGFGAEQQRHLAKDYAESCLARYLHGKTILETGVTRAANSSRLKIGYLSADLREHPVSHLLVGVLECHDRNCFEVFAYSIGRDDGTAMRTRIADAVDIFRDIRDLPHEAAARLINEDGIDVLIDLMGWTTNTRMEITALRPAPIQVSWLGYPGSVGHPRLADYLIGDPVVTPLDHADFYVETLALMPHSMQPNDRKRVVGVKPGRLEAGLPDTGFVFCSFSQSYKINPAIFNIWCKLLMEVEGSVLWLLSLTEMVRENLRREAHARGIDPARLIFAPYAASLEDHLGRLQCADLALDTFPYGSHTTGSDALWAGVPLVVCLGGTFASRVSSSLVSAAGLPELIASSDEEYFALALRLATHPDELGLIRRRLADNRLTCPLFDTSRFTRDIERLFMAMWEDHRAGRKAPILLSAEKAMSAQT